MHDSYGDGWNGATLEIFRNNQSLGIFSASNNGTVDTFQVCTGDSIRLFYTAADYEEENSYALIDAAYNVVYSAGPNPATGIVFNNVGDCNTLPAPGTSACTAILIDTGACVQTSNTNFPGSGLNPGCANYAGADIWYKLIVPPSGNVYFNTSNGGLNDTGLALWVPTDSSCFTLQAISCDDDGGGGYYSLVAGYDLIPGQTLYIQAFGYGGGTGEFQLCAHDLGIIQFDGSELPIVVINTQNQSIVTETKIDALMDIKYNGDGNYTLLNQEPNIYSGHVGIEIRGATSAGYPQRPYGFETRDNLGENLDVELLGMPAENDWVLLSNYNDRSFIRNTLAFKLANWMGQYASRTKLCEVMIDSSYKGIYVFGEKIKRNTNRVDIAKLYSYENAGDDLTGGYIFSQSYWDDNNSFLSNYSPIDHPEMEVHFVYEYPKLDSITLNQRNYLRDYVDSLETALYSSNFADTATGYRKYLDTKSFIDYFLINELSRNNDGFKKSEFFFKDKFSNGGKVHAGPVWDFDWAWKNMATCDIFSATDGSGWAHEINDCEPDNPSCGWYIRLMQDTSFQNELRCTYESYRDQFFNTEYLFGYIDSVGTLVQNAQARHFKKWPILGVSGPAPEIGIIPTTYTAELDTLKMWIMKRLAWLEAAIPGHCWPDQTGIMDVENGDLTVYPNPSKGLFELSGWNANNAPVNIQVYDASGRLVLKENCQTKNLQKHSIQLSQPGLYLIQIQLQNRMIRTSKILVEE